MQKKSVILIGSIFLSLRLFAQHDHHPMPAKPDTTIPVRKDTLKKQSLHDQAMPEHGDHAGHAMQMEVPMSHAFSLNLPMTRNGSGTGWLPDASPMYGYMLHSRKWMYMLHGSVFLRYNNQDVANKGSRGDAKWDAPTWLMFMGQRKAGKNGLFHFNTMFSLDPLIEGSKGYPLLFQTGESYRDRPLVDRQHPHDLFSELSISYTHAFNKKTDAFIYLAYPGEPALGPVTFMHRPSSLSNPNSPLSHHWVDATHITFGVATAGLRLGRFKAEASSFTGREPDEDRYSFDQPRFDSWSGRLSFNPTANWALQVSHGYLESPEELHTDENVHKTTASVIYSVLLGREHWVNATVLWGMNKHKAHEGQQAFLLEGDWRKDKLSVYTRYEFTQKSAQELVLEPLFDSHDVFGIHGFTLGANYDLFEFSQTRVAGGAQGSFYKAPASLNAVYGKNPVAVQVYLRIYPALMRMRQ